MVFLTLRWLCSTYYNFLHKNLSYAFYFLNTESLFKISRILKIIQIFLLPGVKLFQVFLRELKQKVKK